MPWPLGHTVWSFSTKPAGTPRVSSRFRKTSPCCRCRPHVRSSMQQRTSGNTCARPISPTVYSRATPTFLMPVRPPGASFSTKPAASPPSQRATGQSSVNHNEGWYYYPLTVLAEVPDDARAMREEPFGPLALINPVSSLYEAIEKANALPYGLAAYAFTRSARNADRLAEGIEAGNLSINHFVASIAETPFGGVKESGYGREGGTEGLACYTVAKNVSHLML